MARDMKTYTQRCAPVTGAMAYFFGIAAAHAGTLTPQGNVTALTDFNQMGVLTGTANFDEGPQNGNIPLNLNAAQGLTWLSGNFAGLLPGIVSTGNATNPIYQVDPQYFPQPIKNGGVQVQQYIYFGGVAKFDTDITQVGLTAGRNGNQFLTAWDKAGKLIGQVNWVPANDASFIGLDTKGVPIGMVAYGNDDMWNGANYSVGGSTIMADTWVWSKGPCLNDAACDDKDMCNGAETCTAGKCTAGTPLDCADDNECTDDSCDKLLGCVNANNVAPCDDANMCTLDTLCAEGACGGGSPLDCADDDVCTEDICDPDNGCGNAQIDGCCKTDDECADDQVCDLDTNTCVIPMTSSSSSGDSSTGDDPSTGGDTSTGDVTASTTDPTTGGDDTSTTAPDPTTGGSDSGGEPVTTTAGPETTSPTTGGPIGGETTGSPDTDASSGSDTAGVDDGGCGCRTQTRGDHLLGALASLGFGLALRRRRRR